jgi:hypothetical protein
MPVRGAHSASSTGTHVVEAPEHLEVLVACQVLVDGADAAELLYEPLNTIASAAACGVALCATVGTVMGIRYSFRVVVGRQAASADRHAAAVSGESNGGAESSHEVLPRQ